MEFGIWLDGVILNQDITDTLSSIYKGIQAKVEPSTEINPDWSDFYKKIRDRGKLFILSPFSKEITQGVLNSLGINESFVYNNGRTKPSKEPTERLVNEFKIDPLRLVIIGSSPLDLLSARFFDSRIKVACVVRRRDCSRYSPFVMAKNLHMLFESLNRLGLLD